MGISQALPPSVKLNLAVGLGSDVLAAGAFAAGGIDAPERHTVLAFGSVQRRGLRPLPLIHVALGGGWGIDAHVVAAYVLPPGRGSRPTWRASATSVDGRARGMGRSGAAAWPGRIREAHPSFLA